MRLAFVLAVLAAILTGGIVFLLTQGLGGYFLRTAANPGVETSSPIPDAPAVCRRYCFVDTPEQPGYSHRLCQEEFQDGICSRYEADVTDTSPTCSGYDLLLDGSSVLVQNGQWICDTI